MSRRIPHVALVAVAALAATACAVDRHEVAYDGYFDAKAQDAIKREWVPEWLPEDATDIREVHAGDSRRALLRATLPPDASLPAECAPVDVPPTPALDAEWFPANVTSLGEVSVCDDDSYVVVADDVLYRWTVGPKRTDDPSPTSLPSQH